MTKTSISIDHAAIRAQFPLLAQLAGDSTLVFLDSAASTQQPLAVIDSVAAYQRDQHANIHRAVYRLSQEATRRYEEARAKVASFINAADPVECLFTRGTTESINLVAAAWGRANLKPDDEIVLSTLEHHSNIVPWQLVAQATGARIRVIPINDAGELDLDAYRALLGPRTRMVAVNHVSNALGTINPVREIIAAAHAAGALALIDGAQWVAHGVTDVQALDADFYAFSGHKLYGPTGIGALYGKRALLESMPPYQGGGDMIEKVSFTETTFAGLPNRFEAGTPNIAGALGLGAAIDWVLDIGLEPIGKYEQRLLTEATERMQQIQGLEIKGTAAAKSGVISFRLLDPPISTLDLGTELDLRGICIRTGHHCCQPLMQRLGVSSTARASFALYNNQGDIERLVEALHQIVERARSSAAAAAAAKPAAMEPVGQAPGLEQDSRSGVPASTQAAEDSEDSVAQQAAGAVKVDEPSYPTAVADSPEAVADALAEDFELLPDWPTRHQYLIELGDRLPPMPAAMKTDATRVEGCQSTVYMAARVKPDSENVIEFLADSDANIVRGLIALLEQLCSGQRAESILGFDLDAFFSRIGLDAHLSLSRRNGLAAMVQRLRLLAHRYAA